MIHQNYYNWNY